MIFKILEEMRQVRIKEDYKNYRTLSDILIEYINNDIFRFSYSELNKEKLQKVNTLTKWLDSELQYLNEIVETFLNQKDYGKLKIVSQVDGCLQRLKNRLDYIKKSSITIN